MATLYKVHPESPQSRKIDTIRDALKDGAVMLYPTDTVYAIGCDLTSKAAIQKVRQIKQFSNDKPLTFLCSSLSNISEYAWVSDPAYRAIRRLIPGPYTFLLPATKLVPRLVMSPKRQTTGIRVPDHAISLALLEALGNPIISTSALPPVHRMNGHHPHDMIQKAELFDRLDPLVDIILDDGLEMNYGLSTIVDLTTDDSPVIERQGLGWEAAIAQGAVLAAP
ncbi:MAG: threonylcarbamoyl-AMP synthase [Leptolyngbyaceae cyanobacterium T60_A2020_046]|nr:threonylcarbamoyl-AMP synthase [Leptolyngbyaceae cyanobacterium T60_A2020_046]